MVEVWAMGRRKETATAKLLWNTTEGRRSGREKMTKEAETRARLYRHSDSMILGNWKIVSILGKSILPKENVIVFLEEYHDGHQVARHSEHGHTEQHHSFHQKLHRVVPSMIIRDQGHLKY